MKEIVNRLQENRQIELAKSILESAGYKVTKNSEKLKENSSQKLSDKISNEGEFSETVKDLMQNIEEGEYDDDDGSMMQSAVVVLELLKAPADKVYMVTENGESEAAEEAFDYLQDMKSSLKPVTHKIVGDSEGVGDYRSHLYLYNSPEGVFVYLNNYGYEEFYYL